MFLQLFLIGDECVNYAIVFKHIIAALFENRGASLLE